MVCDGHDCNNGKTNSQIYKLVSDCFQKYGCNNYNCPVSVENAPKLNGRALIDRCRYFISIISIDRRRYPWWPFACLWRYRAAWGSGLFPSVSNFRIANPSFSWPDRYPGTMRRLRVITRVPKSRKCTIGTAQNMKNLKNQLNRIVVKRINSITLREILFGKLVFTQFNLQAH